MVVVCVCVCIYVCLCVCVCVYLCVCVRAVVPLNAVATAMQSAASTCLSNYVEWCECYIMTLDSLPCYLGTAVILVILKPLLWRPNNRCQESWTTPSFPRISFCCVRYLSVSFFYFYFPYIIFFVLSFCTELHFFSFACFFSLYSVLHISIISPCFIFFLDSIPFTFV
jgi:hypothetical protein